jgi:FMN phosphatase YigB (HAD superfamily)
LWNERDFSRHFDAMHYSAELGVQKPEPEFFRLVQERESDREIVFLDDRMQMLLPLHNADGGRTVTKR